MIGKEVLKGATLGAGSLASEFAGETISKSIDFKYADEITGIGLGLAGVVGLNQMAAGRYGGLTEYGSYFAYGLEANGFKKLYENFVQSPQASVSAEKVNITPSKNTAVSNTGNTVSAKQEV